MDRLWPSSPTRSGTAPAAAPCRWCSRKVLASILVVQVIVLGALLAGNGDEGWPVLSVSVVARTAKRCSPLRARQPMPLTSSRAGRRNGSHAVALETAEAGKTIQPPGPPPMRPATFVFMVQARWKVPEKWSLRSHWPQVAVICLLWDEEANLSTPLAGNSNADHISERRTRNTGNGTERLRVFHYPGSTWATGRNRLLEEAKAIEAEQGWRFEFFVLLDEDAFLAYRTAEQPEKVIVESTDDTALRMFMGLLLRDRPMRAGVGFNPSEDLLDDFSAENFGCIRKSHVDPIVAAYHRTGVDILLPYTARFDGQSWYASGIIADIYAAAVVPRFCLEYQVVLVELSKQLHHDYPKYMEYNALVRHVNECLARAMFRDYKHHTVMNEIKRKLGEAIWHWPGMHIGDHFPTIRERDCYRSPPGVDYARLVGTETLDLWRKHCV